MKGVARRAGRPRRRSPARGIDAEVVDMRSLRPLDVATVLASVGRRAGWWRSRRARGPAAGPSGLVGAVAEEGLDLLEDVWTLTTPDTPIPFSPPLEDAYLPGSGTHRGLRAPVPPGGRLMGYRISVDTGGTFTDVVVAADDGTLTIGKALTTYERAFEGIGNALADIAADLGLDARAAARARRASSPTARRAPPTRSSRARRRAPRSSPPRASRTSCCCARAASSSRSARSPTRRPTSRAS